MCQYSAADGCAGDWHLQHLPSLAMSGAGLVMVEATGVERRGRITHGCLGLYSDDCEAALARALAAARRVAGPAKFGIQLAHAGRKASSQVPWEGGQALRDDQDPWPTVSASAIAFDAGWHVPQALDEDGMDRVTDAFVHAARRAVRLGFEVIELHSAHGYLLHQFLSPLSNQRDDALWRDARQPHAVSAAGARGRAGRRAVERRARHAHLGDRLGRGRLGRRRFDRVRRRGAVHRHRLRLRLVRRPDRAGARADRSGLPGAGGGAHPCRNGRGDPRRRPDHLRTAGQFDHRRGPGRPGRAGARASSTIRAGAGTRPMRWRRRCIARPSTHAPGRNPGARCGTAAPETAQRACAPLSCAA